MKRFLPIGVLLLAIAVALPALADSAGSLWKKGHDAEMRQDYEAAYEFYKQAFDQKPRDLRYRTSYERGKFLAAASHVHKGQALRDQGKLQEALAEFDTAVKIDHSSFIAGQELRRTQELIQKANSPDATPTTPQISPLISRLANSSGPVELTPISDTPITLHVSAEDTKVIYETVGKLAGINVLFDPDYTSRRIPITLNGVTLADALGLISMESKTFWRAVTPNTIFVAADTPAKRKELEQNVLKTFYLTNISSPTELQDLVNTLRTVLEIRLMTPLPTQNAVVIRATPDQVALAEKLINDLDKARPEVVVEVAVLQVTREKIRNLGINPPTSAVIQLNPNVTTTTTNSNGTTTNNNSNSGSNGSINLNHIGNLTAKDFQVTIPQASLNAIFSDANTKLIQNPQIRALDGQKASLKIGDRVPVATGSFGAGLGGVGLNSLVNTQFNYIDVGVNIDITPVVHGTREVTLKVLLDVSNVDNQVNIGGVTQPQIGQRKIEHQIRLKEGEVNILGGIFEDSDVKSLSGLPFLSQVPLLKYLFSSTNTDKRENEIVFVMIPHIVRSQDVSPLNMRALEIGTGNNIDLRRAAGTSPAPAPAAGTAAPRGGTAAAPAPPTGGQAAGTTPAGAAPAAGQAASVGFDPQIINQAVGQTFAVDVVMTGDNLYSVPLQIGYDPKTLQLLNVSNGSLLSRDGQIVSLTRRDDPSTGSVTLTATRPPNAAGISGQGSVFTLTFMAKSAGESSLVITKAGVRDAGMQAVNVSGTQAHVNIK
jgi:general secretion pathway protein D